MTIYLHCGAHKTASQFTKKFLQINEKLFNLNGIGLHLDKFFEQKEVSATDIIKLVEQDQKNGYQHTFISEDANIIGLMPGLFTAKKSCFFAPRSIAKFTEQISQLNQKYQIKFLLCVRQQDSYIESCYKFRKTSGAAYSFKYFMSKVQEMNLSWFDLIETVAQQIGQENCFVTPYELLKESEFEFISTFLKPILTIDQENVTFPQAQNLGASELAMSVINYFDHQFPEIPGKHRREILSLFKQHQSHESSKKIKRDKTNYLSSQDRREILAKYAQSNQKLFTNYTSFPPNYYDCKLLEPANLELAR